MIGQQTVSVMLYVVGMFPLILVFAFPVGMTVTVLIIASVIFTLFSVLWINYLISYNRLQPLINRIRRENYLVWIRITKDKLLTFQVVKKGVYGQTKGIKHGMKADVIDKGDFPVQCLNGNPAIIVYDKSSHNQNLDEAIGWKQLFKKHKITTGISAYRKAKKQGE